MIHLLICIATPASPTPLVALVVVIAVAVAAVVQIYIRGTAGFRSRLAQPARV